MASLDEKSWPWRIEKGIEPPSRQARQENEQRNSSDLFPF
jgi:hypothetical protein